MRRVVLALLLGALLVAACSDDDPTTEPVPTTSPTSVVAGADLPDAVRAFVDDVAPPGSVAFRATYRVLRKLGGGERSVEVVAEPPSWHVRADDLLVVDGPKPATCRISRERCVGEVREELLAPIGVFSRFFATAPASALATDARREGAGDAVASTRSVAGVDLRCLSVPIRGATPSTYCLTPEGIFGWVDTPAVRFELVAYRPGPTGESAGVPYPIVTNGGFLTQ